MLKFTEPIKGTWQLKFIYFIVSYFMLSIRSLVEGLGVFERVPLEFKILGLVYIQLSS